MRTIAAIIALILAGCTDGPAATRILKAEGFEQIEITGYRFTSCSDDDVFSTGFSARKNGHIVTGTVCSGWVIAGFGKGHTIRYD